MRPKHQRMKTHQITSFLALFAFSACQINAPSPPAGAIAAEPIWREVAPDNLVLLELRTGTVVIELAAEAAPMHAAQFRSAVRGGVYENEFFYRVIDGHVAQAGLEFDARLTNWPALAFEAERAISAAGFAPHGNGDLFTKAPGHRGGFAVGRDGAQEWLLHCPGAIGMARDIAVDSGSIEFFIPLQPRRYLDRNYTVFGRVISGMEHIHRLKRAEPATETETPGFFDPATGPGKFAARAQKLAGNEIVSARLASDMPVVNRPRWQVMATPSAGWEALKNTKRDYANIDAFVSPPPRVLDVCSLPVPARPAP
jgi:cyclophilin family peptidyl-prolyl cis-trans isomerase